MQKSYLKFMKNAKAAKERRDSHAVCFAGISEVVAAAVAGEAAVSPSPRSPRLQHTSGTCPMESCKVMSIGFLKNSV